MAGPYKDPPKHAATCEHGLRINGASMAHQKDNFDAMCPFCIFICPRALAAQALDAQLDAQLMRGGRLIRNFDAFLMRSARTRKMSCCASIQLDVGLETQLMAN